MASLMDAPDVLRKIAAYKEHEVAALYDEISIDELRDIARDQAAPRGFESAIKSAAGPALIAEVKKASPSKGIIREDFDPAAIAKAYARGGAVCLSVLTDGPGFQGSAAIFKTVRQTTQLPLLRKDFMIDPIQIVESAAMGADCVLIIMAMIDDQTAEALFAEANALGLDALIETHNISEVLRARSLGGTLIGVNNRDLRTFDTTLDTFAPLMEHVGRGKTIIAESGIFTPADIARLTREGAQGFLVGESLMRQDDVEAATRALIAG